MAEVAEGKALQTTQGIELRSIDWVPHEERHGEVWHLGGVWFSGNAELTTTASGVLAISLGGNLIWTMIGLLLGTLFGTFFTAFHSAQGPQLGLPQMIQSRAQFGYLGVAVLVLPFMVFNYAGYNVFNGLLAAGAMDNVVGGGIKTWLVITAVVALLAAIWGYDLIHLSQRWLTYGFIIFFGVYTIGVLATIGFPANAWDLGDFQMTPFLASFAITVSYQIGWAPYVSDYSRYLPASVGVRSTFMWTYWPLVIAGVWMFWMGAIIAAPIAAQAPSTVDAIRTTGDDIFSNFGAVVLLLSVPALVLIIAMNMYGGALILISMADSFRKLNPALWHRIVGISAIGITSLVFAFYSTSNADFLGYYNNLIVLLLYFFAPWTAVNLVDYFLVRKGHYAIKEIFNPTGIYHRWGWMGIGSYMAGFVAMIPFMVIGTAGTKFEWWIGPIARDLSYTDISVFIGIPVSAIVYLLWSRKLDLAKERELEAGEHMTFSEIESELVAEGEYPGGHGIADL
jgi:nucleobase:cation symporter-1, NCS1 family